MKRAITALLLLGLLLCLAAGCGYTPQTITDVRPRSVSRLVLTRLEDGRELEYTQGAAEIRRCVEALEAVAVRYQGDCDEAKRHAYRLRLYVGETLNSDIYLHADGVLCRTGKLRVPEQETEGAELVRLCEQFFADAPEEAAVEEGRWAPVTEPAEYSAPLPAPSMTRWLSAQPVAENEGGWRYILATVEISGERYTVFSRERSGREPEIIYGFSTKNSGGYLLVYTEDSFETSGGAYLRFELMGEEPPAAAEGEPAPARERIPYAYEVERELFRRGEPDPVAPATEE